MGSGRIPRGFNFKWESAKFRGRKNKRIQGKVEPEPKARNVVVEGEMASKVGLEAKELGKKPEAKSPQKDRLHPEMEPETVE